MVRLEDGAALLTCGYGFCAPHEIQGLTLRSSAGRRRAISLTCSRGAFSRDELPDMAALLDAGFDLGVLVQLMRTSNAFADEEIPLPSGDVASARAFFADWSQQLQAADR